MAHQARVKKTFCTTREAAQILGVALRTAQLWTESGLLEAWKTEGGHRRITRESVERLLADPKAQQLGTDTAAKTAATALPGKAPRPFSILVVEDEDDLRRVYEIVLSRWPLHPRVVAVADGYEALLRIGLDKPDIVITDLRMPGMDGFQMINALRMAPELAATAVIVVTGMDPNEIDAKGGIPAGIPVLPKPIPFDQLHELVEQAAKHHSPTSHAS